MHRGWRAVRCANLGGPGQRAGLAWRRAVESRTPAEPRPGCHADFDVAQSRACGFDANIDARS